MGFRICDVSDLFLGIDYETWQPRSDLLGLVHGTAEKDERIKGVCWVKFECLGSWQ